MNKKSLTYLVVLVLLVIIFIVINSNDKVERRINFFAVDSSKIAVIEIYNIKDTLKLMKTDDKWMIDHPVKYPVAAAKLKDLFEKAIPVETSNIPVAESETSFETYGLTAIAGLNVKLYDTDGKELVHAIIGGSSNYNYSHGRSAGDNEVYQLYENISSVLNPGLNAWREKVILDLVDDPEQITVMYGDRMYSITSSDSLWFYEDSDSTFSVNESNRALSSILSNSKSFRTSTFIDNDYETYAEKLIEPEMVIQIKLFSGDVIFMKFVQQDEEGNKHIVQKNDETEHLYIVYDNMVKYFQKEISEFIQ